MDPKRVIPAAKTYLALFFAPTIPLAWVFWIPMILINRGIWTPPVAVPTIVWSTLGAVSPLVALGILQRVSRQQVNLKVILSKALASLPLVRERQIAFEVMALTPYTGFERLFGGKGSRASRHERPQAR